MFRKIVFMSMLLLLFGLSNIICKAKAGQAPKSLELGPMLGYIGPDKARIWLKALSAAKSGIIIGQTEDVHHDGQMFIGPELTSETEYMGVIEVSGLQPVTRYFYKPVLDGQVSPEPPFSFVTAPPKGFQTRFRFAFISGIGDFEKYLAQWRTPLIQAWEELSRIPIDLLLLLGDNVYAGSTEPELQRRLYYWHRRLPTFQKVTAVTPTLAIWDDWDYADNDSDGTAPGKGRTRIFLPTELTDRRKVSGSWLFSFLFFADQNY